MMKIWTLRRILTIAAFALAQTAGAMPGVALADDAPGAIGISEVVGDVGVQRGDTDQPVAASRNAPMLPDDVLSTGDGGRAEIRIDRGSRLRLDSKTLVRVVRVDGNGTEVDLGGGTVELRVFHSGSTTQIDTPSAAVFVKEPGRYVVRVNDDGTALVTTYEGNATITGPSLNDPLPAGQSVALSGTSQAPSVQSQAAVDLDTDFASFNDSRDQQERAAFDAAQQQQQPEPAAAQQDGADDLSGYGHWLTTDDGAGWVPNEPPDWSPYSNGSFAWEQGYGWTWIAAEPWGWVPFHYGSWAFENGIGWVWIPGAPAPWQPAPVAFFQTANGVAWLPLGPHDVVVASGARVSLSVVELRRYRNYRYPHAFVEISRERFEHGDFRHFDRVGYAQLGHPFLVGRGAFVVPTRANLAFAPREIHGIPRFPERLGFAGHPVVFHRPPFGQGHTLGFSHTYVPPRPIVNTHPVEGGGRVLGGAHPPIHEPAAVRPAFGPVAGSHTGPGPEIHPTAVAPVRSAFGPAAGAVHPTEAAPVRSAFGPAAGAVHPTEAAPVRSTFGPSAGAVHPTEAAPVRSTFGPSAAGPAAASSTVHSTFGPTASSTTHATFGPSATGGMTTHSTFGPSASSAGMHATYGSGAGGPAATRTTFGPSATTMTRSATTYGPSMTRTTTYGSRPVQSTTYGSRPVQTNTSYGSRPVQSTTNYGSTTQSYPRSTTESYSRTTTTENYQRPAPAPAYVPRPAAPAYVPRPAPAYVPRPAPTRR